MRIVLRCSLKADDFRGLALSFEKADFLELVHESGIVHLLELIEEERLCIYTIIQVAEGLEGVVVISVVNCFAELPDDLGKEAFTFEQLQIMLVFFVLANLGLRWIVVSSEK